MTVKETCLMINNFVKKIRMCSNFFRNKSYFRMELDILDSQNSNCLMAKGKSIMLMATITKDSFWTVLRMVSEYTNSVVRSGMKANLLIIKWAEKVFITIVMEISTKASSWGTRDTGKGFTNWNSPTSKSF